MEIKKKIVLFIKKISSFQNLGPLFVLILMVLILSLLSENFFTITNIFNISKQISVNIIIALGMTIVIIGGGIDLSVGSLMALSGVVMAILNTRYGFHPILAILIGILVGTALGAINGLIISKTKTPDFIITLGMMSVATGIALIISGGYPITNLSPAMTYIGSAYLFDFIPVSVVVAFVLCFIMGFVLNYTMLGRCSYVIGGNVDAAISSGINIVEYKVKFFALSGFLCSIASVVQIGRIFSANSLMGSGRELTAIAAVIIGGTNLFGGAGTILGTVIGAVIMGIISNGLNLLNVSSFFQEFFMGLLIIVVVVLNQLRRKY